MMKKNIMLLLLMFISINFCHGQVLISLLLGDKLNSDKLEFGLDGGLTLTNISNIPQSESRASFFLGFYFDIVIRNQWSIYTGLMAKSPMGAKGLAPYAVGNDQLDQLLEASSLERRLSYISVPVMIRYTFQNHIFLEGGAQVGLLHNAEDEFSGSLQKEDDLLYEHDIIDQYKRLDFGLSAGVGYKLMQGEGISLGLRYYGGLVDIQKEGGAAIRNNALYIFANIPIGGVKDKEALNE
ncbi:porin family protein [Catalinimonas sp. 4WD22]|uniref:porin family protein n=1 Tax=Catalinimonas locisalis TaxID=3133978 RepID=UPI003100C601